jgi:hypothetical protein
MELPCCTHHCGDCRTPRPCGSMPALSCVPWTTPIAGQKFADWPSRCWTNKPTVSTVFLKISLVKACDSKDRSQARTMLPAGWTLSIMGERTLLNKWAPRPCLFGGQSMPENRQACMNVVSACNARSFVMHLTASGRLGHCGGRVDLRIHGDIKLVRRHQPC